MKTMHEGAAAALHSGTPPTTLTGAPATALATALAPALGVASVSTLASAPAPLGLDGLKARTPALVTGLVPARDGREHSTLLRLLEIGFVPGESVQVLARGAWGGDPLAVRVGQATFALRHEEASMVQVQPLALAQVKS